TSIQPLVERLAIGSTAGRSASLLINDSRGSSASATMISPPRYLYVEPWSYPHILNRQRQTQNQFHRQCQQHAHRKKLESEVLQQTRSRQKLLFERVLGKQIRAEWPAETDPLEVHRHQPVQEERADQIEAADDNKPENKLRRILAEKMKIQPLRNHVVQVDVLVEHHRVVIPRLTRPKPNPSRPADKRSDDDQKDPHQKAPAKHQE